jgi:lycopene beta-cyclase
MGLGQPESAAKPVLRQPNYVLAGLTAGAARPATGYAFQRIQRWALACKQSIQRDGIPIGHQQDSFIIRNMDAIFLKVLRSRPELGPELFMKLFSGVSSDRLIRFLSDRGVAADYLAVMSALPAGLFIKSAYQLATRQ